MNLQMITTIVQGVCLVLTGLLALDNAVDAIAKAFGNKKVDTICGVIGYNSASSTYRSSCSTTGSKGGHGGNNVINRRICICPS